MTEPNEQTTEIKVAGADCPWCLNAATDALRSIEGVHDVRSSMAEECIYVVHDGVPVADLLASLRSNLHGTDESAHESQLGRVDPVPITIHCTHGHAPGSVPAAPRPRSTERGLMETLTEAMARLRAEGYRADFSATADGQLRCASCGTSEDPATMVVGEVVRFEGESNPADESILLAVACSCGCLGQFSAAYGPDTPPEDAEVLLRIARRAAMDRNPPAG